MRKLQYTFSFFNNFNQAQAFYEATLSKCSYYQKKAHKTPSKPSLWTGHDGSQAYIVWYYY